LIVSAELVADDDAGCRARYEVENCIVEIDGYPLVFAFGDYGCECVVELVEK
jgi:hypothetical protein